LSATNDLAGTGILRNPQESSGNRSKYRNSCPTGIPAKNSSKFGKKGIPATSPKPRSYKKFLRKKQENKKILRNPVRNAFLCTKNKFLKKGITKLGYRALLLTRLHCEVILLTDGSTISSVLGRHYISLQIPRDFQSIFLHFFSLTTDGCPFILTPT